MVLAGTGTSVVAAKKPAVTSTQVVVAACTAVPPAGPMAGFTGEQLANAATIIATTRSMGGGTHGSVVALATAMQESALRNVNYGDRDSLGLFQQRPSQGWGSPTQVRDPVYATTQFVRRLLVIPGWQQLPVTVAAQTVQRSGFPGAYAKWENPATAITAAVPVTCKPR